MSQKKVYAVNLKWEIVGGKKSLEGILEPAEARFIGTHKQCKEFIEEHKPAENVQPVFPDTLILSADQDPSSAEDWDKAVEEARKNNMEPIAITPTRGIVLIALGHQQYGRMAFNLLVSIRAAEPDMPIALIHNDSSITHLTMRQKQMFTQLIRCPEELYSHGGKRAYVKPKCWLYELSPFNKTLFLDSDMLLMPGKRIGAMMDELAGNAFTIKNTGAYNIETKQHSGNPQYGYGGWETARLHELAGMYELTAGQFTQLQGEVFYFEKSPLACRIFEYAREAWTDQRAFIAGGFAGQNMNDELAFIIALARAGACAHVSPWVPSYWYLLEGGVSRLNRTNAIANFWLLSAGGHNVPGDVMDFYNDIAGKSHYQMGLRMLFPMRKPKMEYLTERKLF